MLHVTLVSEAGKEEKCEKIINNSIFWFYLHLLVPCLRPMSAQQRLVAEKK